MSNKLTSELHKEQIEAYTRQYSDYVIFAKALRRVLEDACAASLPEANVQARAKSIPSFAEKCARKFDKYPDAVNQFTDLCGARLIVLTLEQVEAAKLYIRCNFLVVEEDDKAFLLSTDKFGYRDLHFINQFRPDRPFDLSPEEIKTIGERKAELQMPTWVQHAWTEISMMPEQLSSVTAFLKEALVDFSGMVVSEGTTVGVPGCVGEAAKHLTDLNTKHFHLRGYIPKSLPNYAEKDTLR